MSDTDDTAPVIVQNFFEKSLNRRFIQWSIYGNHNFPLFISLQPLFLTSNFFLSFKTREKFIKQHFKLNA